jgi:hypothetical protein
MLDKHAQTPQRTQPAGQLACCSVQSTAYSTCQQAPIQTLHLFLGVQILVVFVDWALIVVDRMLL